MIYLLEITQVNVIYKQIYDIKEIGRDKLHSIIQIEFHKYPSISIIIQVIFLAGANKSHNLYLLKTMP